MHNCKIHGRPFACLRQTQVHWDLLSLLSFAWSWSSWRGRRCIFHTTLEPFPPSHWTAGGQMWTQRARRNLSEDQGFSVHGPDGLVLHLYKGRYICSNIISALVILELWNSCQFGYASNHELLRLNHISSVDLGWPRSHLFGVEILLPSSVLERLLCLR